MRARLHALERRTRRAVLGDDYARSDGACRAAPEWLVLCINNFCNLHCKMCDVGLGESGTPFYQNLIGDHPQNMSFELLERIGDQAKRFRPPPRVGLAYTEPLLHRNVVAFCRALKRQSLETHVTTNGYLLPQLAEGLVDAGLDAITVSVDGPRAVHNRVRGSKESFERLYRGIEILGRLRGRRRRSSPSVRLSYTITDENYTDMVRLLQDVEALEIDAISFSHLNFVTSEVAAHHNVDFPGELAVRRSNLGAMDLGRIDTGALWKALVELDRYERDHALPLTIVPRLRSREELDVYYRNPETFVGGTHCTDPWRMMMIQTDGVVIPAHGRCYNLPVGRLPEHSLQEIWNGSPFQSFRRTLHSAGGALPACSRCCGVIGKPASP